MVIIKRKRLPGGGGGRPDKIRNIQERYGGMGERGGEEERRETLAHA